LAQTAAGIAVNPQREDVRDRLVAGGSKVVSIEENPVAGQDTSGPEPKPRDERIVAVVEERDGTVSDAVRAVA